MDNEKVLKAMRLASWPYTMSSLNMVEGIAKVIECYNTEEAPEAWREEFRKKQVAGVRYEFNFGTSLEPIWRYRLCEFLGEKEEYRVKPKTEKCYFAVCAQGRYVFLVSDKTPEAIKRRSVSKWFEIVGDIVEREVEL